MAGRKYILSPKMTLKAVPKVPAYGTFSAFAARRLNRESLPMLKLRQQPERPGIRRTLEILIQHFFEHRTRFSHVCEQRHR